MWKRSRKTGPDVWYFNLPYEGKEYHVNGGTEKRAAEKRRRELLDLIEAGEFSPEFDLDDPEPGKQTLDKWAKKYFSKKKHRNSKRDEGQYRKHISGKLGHVPLRDIGTRRIVELIDELREKSISAKTVVNVHGILSTMLQHAAMYQYIDYNPARNLARGYLPKPSKRKIPAYTREEVSLLIMSPIVRADIRMLAAMCTFGGMRLGEACGRRLSDYDDRPRPLGSLHVWSQYEDLPLKSSKDEDTKERIVPVHPTLAQMLTDWISEGFEEFYGRAPRPDDFIAPRPTNISAHSESTSGKAFRKTLTDLDIKTVPRQRTHGMRRAFVSIARSHGMDKVAIARISHNPTGDIVDQYTFYEWSPLCDIVMSIDLSEQSNVIDLRRAK